MQSGLKQPFKHTWEEAIDILREDPKHQTLIYDSYLTRDLVGNARRFAASDEFREAHSLLTQYAPNARQILDMPGGNGIATFAFASCGFDVTAVEPNPSDSVGRGAINTVLTAGGVRAELVEAWGESLPFASNSFDVVYVRQGLHHASDLKKMIGEIARVLRPGGVMLACREHVVDDYGSSLQAFLDSQVDHQLYGGENAFTLPDYLTAMRESDFDVELCIAPFDSVINAYPNTPEVLREKILASRAGRVLRLFLSLHAVTLVGQWYLKRKKMPGRLYSFLARKRGL